MKVFEPTFAKFLHNTPIFVAWIIALVVLGLFWIPSFGWSGKLITKISDWTAENLEDVQNDR